MQSTYIALVSLVGLASATGALAAGGEDIYAAKCSLCHDSGAGQAPKTGDPADWSARVVRGRDALYESALKGKPNTAMMAKGGYPDLSDTEVKSAVDYMLAKSGYDPTALPAVVATKREALTGETPVPAVRSARLDDAAVTASIAEALRRDIAPPGAPIETYAGVTIVGGVGVKIETHAGVVVLSGMVKSAEVAERAERIARTVDGVRRVDNKLISATLFEWD